MSATTLILGYGNPDRQDDGVAWHILCDLAARLGRTIPSFEEGFDLLGDNPDLHFVLQLMPEMAEMMADYQRVCFIDAHTGAIPENVKLTRLSANYQRSPLTHHTTPQTCLALAKTLYHTELEAILVSVRGFKFGFAHGLTPETAALAQKAETMIWTWFSDGITPEQGFPTELLN